MTSAALAELAKELQKIDPTARVTFAVHDEIAVECADDKQPQVHARLHELLLKALREELEAERGWLRRQTLPIEPMAILPKEWPK